MALDGVFRMKGATPNAMNEVAANVINSEKQYLPAPRIGCVPDINAAKLKKTWVEKPPNVRHEDAVLKQLTYGCNSGKQVRELQRVYKNEIDHRDRSLSISQHFTDPNDPVMKDLQRECDDKLAQMKQANIDRFALPATSAGVVGQLAVNPLHPKWRRSEGPGQTWRFPKDECDIVLFGKQYYETCGVNMFSYKAKEQLFAGQPS
ncbi:unnamed protein product [Amoebophrya sp. A120]|nr:unnamed protein product [Amoebophrya sp. A120]|eukprot:GSA120T00020403001.1